MGQKVNYFKVGLFVIIGSFFLVLAIIIFGGGKFFRQKFYFETYFNQSVQGLSVGAPVKVLGVEVGSVSEITFVPAEYKTDLKYILVRGFIYPDRFARGGAETERRFDSEIEKEIKNGFRLQLASQGVTGIAFLDGVFFDPNQYPRYTIDWKPERIYVPSAPSTITTITDSITELTNEINEINFKEISDDVQNLLAVVTKSVEEAQVAAVSQRLQETILEFKKVAIDMDSIIEGEDLGRSLRELNESLENVRAASEDLPEAAANLNIILRRLDNLIARRQDEISLILDNIAVISEDLREFMELANNYPAWILFGNPPPKLDGVIK